MSETKPGEGVERLRMWGLHGEYGTDPDPAGEYVTFAYADSLRERAERAERENAVLSRRQHPLHTEMCNELDRRCQRMLAAAESKLAEVERERDEARQRLFFLDITMNAGALEELGRRIHAAEAQVAELRKALYAARDECITVRRFSNPKRAFDQGAVSTSNQVQKFIDSALTSTASTFPQGRVDETSFLSGDELGGLGKNRG